MKHISKNKTNRRSNKPFLEKLWKATLTSQEFPS